MSDHEQLKRFQSRENDELRRWKLTDEDWRNRKRRGDYERAYEEMLTRSDHPHARWQVVAAESKHYARRHRMLEGVATLDFQLLRTIKDMTSHLEVRQCTTGQWEQALLQGFEVWRCVLAARGGRIAIDLDARRIAFFGPGSANQSLEEPST